MLQSLTFKMHSWPTVLKGQRSAEEKAEQLAVTILRGTLQLPAEMGVAEKSATLATFGNV